MYIAQRYTIIRWIALVPLSVALLIATLFLGASFANAADENTISPSCSSEIFINSSTSGTTPSGLYNVNTQANPLSYDLTGSISSVNINALGYNPTDNYLYGITTTGANTNKYLYRVDPATGVFSNLGVVPGLYANTNVIAGDFDRDGNYYVKSGNTSTLHKVDVSNNTAVSIPLVDALQNSVIAGSADMAYSPTTNSLWAIDGPTRRLYSISLDDATLGVVTFKTDFLFPVGGPLYGSMVGSSNGAIYGFSNNGTVGFVQFNTSTGGYTLIANAPGQVNNDGAHCVNSLISFETDLGITKTDNAEVYTPGTTTTYTIVASNNGSFGTMNAHVTDALPSGI